MAWRVEDPRGQQECVIVLPRVQPSSPQSLQAWEASAGRAARLRHPGLAPVIEVSSHDGWPYVAYDIAGAATLAERAGQQGLPARDAASAILQAGQALAYVHEAGVVHGDLQAHLILVPDGADARLMGLEVALPAGEADPADTSFALAQADRLRHQRDLAHRDVLSLGLVMFHALTGQLPLDEPDTAKVIGRLPPLGRDIVRLPWSTPRPVPEALRAIANRATDRQERQRYRSARTLVHALEGWLRADAEADGGALALLLDRLHAVGVLPASPGGAERAARVALMERERTDELAEVVLQDVALSFELLRVVNTAHVRGAQVAGSGPVLTVRRAIAMLGLDGVRRAALGLRAWPGPLEDNAARLLQSLMQRAQRAARVAQALRPAGYDAEVVALVTMLQNLGPLVVQYHFPEDAAQIRRLMQAAPGAQPGDPEEPGMSEQAASFAVLGIEVEAIGAAVARHWGLDDQVMTLIRRWPLSSSVHPPHTDDEVLRTVASCANEALEASGQPATRVAGAMNHVVQRYARALGVTVQSLQEALGAARSGYMPPPPPMEPTPRPPESLASAARLRARA
ncbi:MAG: HDOD domain-containing protein [Rubrivivax sp.]|nr:HDOD domain-containing protein [Rubrivivax sp.]